MTLGWIALVVIVLAYMILVQVGRRVSERRLRHTGQAVEAAGDTDPRTRFLTEMTERVRATGRFQSVEPLPGELALELTRAGGETGRADLTALYASTRDVPAREREVRVTRAVAAMGSVPEVARDSLA
jgi:hypothetical protein